MARGRWTAAGSVAMTAVVLAWAAIRLAPLVVFQRCVSPDRPVAWLGLHLAVLRPSASCPSGQYAVDPGVPHTTGLLVMVAVPTLLANLLALVGIVGAGLTLRALLATAVDVVRALWPRLPRPVRPAAAAPRAVPVAHAVERPPRAWQLDRSPVLRRGPPVLAA